jgi:hypothetical protein
MNLGDVTAGAPYAGTTRQYYSFSQASLENADSRVLAGIHYRSLVVSWGWDKVSV